MTAVYLAPPSIADFDLAVPVDVPVSR